MAGYSIVILICSTALSHADCQPDSAIDIVRGPPVENAIMCSLDAQTMMARTDLVADGSSQYMKVLCVPAKKVDRRTTEIEEHKTAILR